ncbi:MAG: ribosome maturation factor RimP [Oscillospiraceae bacterium]|nr:ribosome maturation factor RimP [Oscillospiraceae bacterium]
MNKIIETVTAVAAPITEKHGCELWNVEYAKEAGNWFLRVYIDHPGGVSINLCESISRELDAILDEREDLIPGSYTFEVSSAGVERHLRGPSDYDRFTGKLAEVKLYKSKNGQKIFLGELAGSRGDGVELDISGQRYSFEKAEIAYVRLRIGSI